MFAFFVVVQFYSTHHFIVSVDKNGRFFYRWWEKRQKRHTPKGGTTKDVAVGEGAEGESCTFIAELFVVCGWVESSSEKRETTCCFFFSSWFFAMHR